MANSDFLRKIPLFSSLPDEDLESLCQIVQQLHLPAGEVLFEEGSSGDMAYIIQTGEVEIVKISQNREILLATRGPGEVFGEIALIFDSPRTASVRARTDTDLVAIGREDLRKLLQINPSAAASMFDIVLTRLQNTQSLLKQSEKMAQLGTFTAGIAHELNNPSAAVQRSAQQLESTLWDSARTFMRLVREELTPPQQDTLESFVRIAQDSARELPELDPLQRSDRETELEDWLDNLGVEDAWDCAATLVNLDFSDDDLARLGQEYSREQLPIVISWLNTNYTILNLLNELKQGAQRISAIVKALKSYTYLDQAPIVRYNVHQGLDDTLLILRHKLRSGITIRRDYDHTLPEIDAHGSELNQVWTNLIDNAADSITTAGMTDGLIFLKTRQEGKWIIVTIEDNGPGIPQSVLPRIFEAFYTTKPVGQGTGLGLDITYNIIVRRHHGDIRVHSEPGQTRFEVWLPTELEEENG
jgi:signal transduction histidine kinase